MSKKKSVIVLVVVIAVLGIAVGVLAALNAGDVAYKKELEMNAVYEIKIGEDTYKISMDNMLALAPVTFSAVLDTSVTDPEDVNFVGVELKKVFESVGVDISGAGTVEIRSLDGYTSALSEEEILQDDNVYITIAEEVIGQDGQITQEALKTKSEGGMGPYLMIVKSSQFSQRWCKFVQEVVVL